MKQAVIFLAEGFEEIEALTPLDVLRRAGVETVSVSVTGSLDVRGAHDIVVRADKLFEDLSFSGFDMLILPGGMPGSDNLNAHAGLRQLIGEFTKSGKWIAAICAAPYILGEMGLLEGRRATCYPGFEGRLAGARVTANPVERDQNIITGRGIGAAMAFSLELVSALLDDATAKNLSKRMVVPE